MRSGSFSGGKLGALAGQRHSIKIKKHRIYYGAFSLGAGPTGLEPAISGLTGRRVNQLHHGPKFYGRYWIRTSDFLLVRQAL